jgi:hypothetical protein
MPYAASGSGMLALVLLAYGLLPLCVSADLLPDPRCTPGDVDVTDLAVVCFQPARERRHVDEATRVGAMQAAFALNWAALK